MIGELLPLLAAIETDRGAQGVCSLDASRYWKIVNRSVKNRLGNPVVYRLVAVRTACPSLMTTRP